MSRRDANVVGVRNTGAELATRLLPTGTPTGGLVCRYDGLNGHPFTLTGGGVLDSAGAGRLAAAVSGQPLSHIVAGVIHCPMDDSSATVAALSYPGRPDVDLWLLTSGCGKIANGSIYASSRGDATVLDTMTRAISHS